MSIGRANGVSTGVAIDKVYPVGSIYISANSVSPTSIFGGIWEQIKDTFLLSAGDGYTAGDTGGSATHAHTTQGHALTIAEMPSHTHVQNQHRHAVTSNFSNGSGSSGAYMYNSSANKKQITMYTDYQTPTNQNTGGGGSHSHGDTGNASSLPPYLVVYMWKRTG